MSDEIALFFILSLIYYTDCFLWIGNHCVAFVSGYGKRWKDRAPSNFIKTSSGGILFLTPFPPLSKVLCSYYQPISFSPSAVCSANCLSQSFYRTYDRDVTTVPIDNIETVSAVDRNILINDKQFQKVNSEQQASKIVTVIKSLCGKSTKDREQLIKQFLEESFDTVEAKKRIESSLKNISPIIFLCNSLFIYLFIISPVFLFYVNKSELLVLLGLGMFLIAVQISIRYFVLHRRLYPDETAERVINLIKMVLCPPTSIRAVPLITKDALAKFDPLTIGHLLFTKSQFCIFAGNVLRHLKFSSMDHLTDKRAIEVIEWQNQMMIEMATDYLRDTANIDADLLSPPKPDGPDAKAYCPRCLAQFLDPEGHCPDCSNIPLVRFHQSETVIKARE